jgi:lysophospholipase L1-like esterase
MNLKPSAKILFQGDSITDSSRHRECLDVRNPACFGHGYVNFIVGQLLGEHPEKNWTFYNRGISGERSVDLCERWSEQALSLAPDAISILIGVNDVWHGTGGRNNGVEPARFAAAYRQILDRTREKLPEAQMILCEPFVGTCGDLRERLAGVWTLAQITRQLAQEYQLPFVPFQAALDEAEKKAPGTYWAYDGVHPTPAGHYLLAKTWLKTTGLWTAS